MTIWSPAYATARCASLEGSWYGDAMLGALIMALVLLAFPVMVAASGVIAAFVLGALVKTTADESHAGSELLEYDR